MSDNGGDRLAELELREAVRDVAATTGADPAALLDSRTFTDKAKALDPSSSEYHDQLADAIHETVAENRRLAHTEPAGVTRGGAELPGGNGENVRTRAGSIRAAVARTYGN